MVKQWWQSKTVWLGVLIVLGGIVEFVGGLPPGASVSTILAGIISIIIRFLTNQPIGKLPSK